MCKLKVEFMDTKEQVIYKIENAGYSEDKEVFAERIIDFTKNL
jgi:hypothetical protein